MSTLRMFARATLSIDPAWPGVSAGRGWMLLAAAAALLVALTVWTYLGARGPSMRRMMTVLMLRLAALAVTVLLMLRPSLAVEEDDFIAPSRLFIVLDVSKSMSIQDEFQNASRFDHARAVLDRPAVQSALKQLADEKKVEIITFQAAEELTRFDPAVKPAGKSTDISRWLDDLRREAAGDLPVQGILIFSDGVDTGVDAKRTLDKAADFRKSPLLTFGVGQANAIANDKDIALDQIFIEPQPILAKGKFKVKVTAQAPGFEDAQTEFSLWIEDRANKMMNKVKSQNVRLSRPDNNQIVIEADAPDVDGEIKITVKAKELPGETSVANNEISTYSYVSKEGIRVLWVEGKKRAYEGVFAIRHALAKDRRIQVVYVERGPGSDNDDPYRFDQTAYDVVVIGDLSAAKFGDTQTLTKIRDRIQNKGMGLVMLGGNETFANGGWQASPIGQLLPFRGDRVGQIDEKLRMMPTVDGLAYLCRLADDPARNKEIWQKTFAPLDGMTQPGDRDPQATVFATADDDKTPMLAGIVRGKGRVLGFTGDTTWKAWRRSPEAVAAYERFWRQMILWLAQQENSQGAVYVQLDQRRLDRPKQVGYRVGFRGIDVVDPSYKAKIVGPRGEEFPVTIGGDPRGTFTPPTPGEYTFVVEGKGKTPLGQVVDGKDSARFLVFETDREMQRPGADHDFLKSLAAKSDGKFALAEDQNVLQALKDLAARQSPPQTRTIHFPDWRKNPAGDGAGEQFAVLWRSTALIALFVYVTCLCTEWYLRRRWGMV